MASFQPNFAFIPSEYNGDNPKDGGRVVAMIHHATEKHLVTDPVLNTKNQPEVASLYFEFLRRCT
ncbi:hypothetical protein F4824DRAFT_494896 [Ustulina deusta]|nr:hypothetical protein F4824DRAFT_494896 [Ustulina deusta]